MQARPFLSLAGLGWFGDLRGGVAQRSNRLGRRFEYVEQCSMALCAPLVCSAARTKWTRKNSELASTDTLGFREFEQALRELVAATAPKSCRNSIARP